MYAVRKYSKLPAMFTGTEAECVAFVTAKCYGMIETFCVVKEK